MAEKEILNDRLSASRWSALWASKCPKCRTGAMFTGSTYGLRKQRFNEICPYCGFRFEIEPGYFYAAMYVSYAMAVIQCLLAGWLAYTFTQSESPWVYLLVLMAAILGCAPFNFRYARLILLHYLTPKVKFDKKYRQQADRPSSQLTKGNPDIRN